MTTRGLIPYTARHQVANAMRIGKLNPSLGKHDSAVLWYRLDLGIDRRHRFEYIGSALAARTNIGEIGMREEDEHRERDEDAVQSPEQHDSGGGGQRPPELPI